MGRYYESNLKFDTFFSDLLKRKIKKITLEEAKNGCFRITYENNHVWISREDDGRTILQRWGTNNEFLFIKFLEKRYKVKFLDEDELNVFQ